MKEKRGRAQGWKEEQLSTLNTRRESDQRSAPAAPVSDDSEHVSIATVVSRHLKMGSCHSYLTGQVNIQTHMLCFNNTTNYLKITTKYDSSTTNY